MRHATSTPCFKLAWSGIVRRRGFTFLAAAFTFTCHSLAPCGESTEQSLSPPTVQFSAEQWPEADVLFHRDPRWVGGDAAYSLDLGGGRVAWFFGDSFVEPPTPGVRRGATMVRNSIGIQAGYDPTTAKFTAYWARVGDRPASLIPDDGEEFFWPGGGVLLDGKLLLFLMRCKNAEGKLTFKTTGWGAVLISQLDQPPDRWQIERLVVPPNNFGVLVGSGSSMCEGQYLYSYSALSSDNHGQRGVYLVRWPRTQAAAGDLSQPAWFDARQGTWIEQSSLAESPTPLFAPGQTEFTVQRLAGVDQLVEVQFLDFPRAAIGYRTAPTLIGPWTKLAPLFSPQELDNDDAEVMLYAGKLHPEQKAQGIALTYASNSWSLRRLVDDPSLYYPRFARVKLKLSTE